MAKIITNLHSVDAFSAPTAEGGRVRKGILCLYLSLTAVKNLRNFLRRLSLLYASLGYPVGRFILTLRILGLPRREAQSWQINHTAGTPTGTRHNTGTGTSHRNQELGIS